MGSLIAAPGAARTARSTACAIFALAPACAGVVAVHLRGSTTTSGRLNIFSTAAVAWSRVNVPTGTPAIVTPAGIRSGAGVVVVVVTVVVDVDVEPELVVPEN